MSLSSPNRSRASRPGKNISFLVEAGPTASAAARREIGMRNGSLPVNVTEDVLLLVTELVTNAVRYGDVGPQQSVRVDLTQGPERVRVEVLDAGTGFEHVPKRPDDREGGWGLFLVERIAARWGISAAAPGTCVWFEIEMR